MPVDRSLGSSRIYGWMRESLFKGGEAHYDDLELNTPVRML